MMPSASPFCEGMLFNCSEYGDFSMYEDFSSIGMYAAAPAAFLATPSTASPHYVNSGHSHFTSPAHFSEESILAQLTPTNTSTKTIPLFMERSRSADEWSRKPVCNWDATDTIDWLFDVAKRQQLSVESLRSGAFSNIRGPQLLQMSLRDYLERDREQGHVYFAAAQQLQQQTPLLPGRSTLDENITGLLELSHTSNPSDGNYYLPQMSNESYATNRNEADCMGLSYCLPLDSSPNLNHHMQMTSNVDHSIPYHYDSNPTAGLLGDDLARSLLETGAELPQLEKIPSMKPDYKYGMDSGSSSVNQDSLDLGFDDPCWNPDGEMFSDSEENCSSADPVSRKVGRPKNKSNNRRKPDKGFGRLWEFIRDLLHDPQYCPSMVRWENVDEGIFRIVKSDKLAELWGTLKNNPNMTYEKLSRAMRYYYKGKIFEPVLGRRLVYKFGHNATNWRPKDPNFERRNGKEII